MARRCKVCSSERLAEINQRLRAQNRLPMTRLAAELEFTPDALERHAAHHLAAADVVVRPGPAPAPPTGRARQPAAMAGASAQAEVADSERAERPARLGRQPRAQQRRADLPSTKAQFLAAYAETGSVSRAAAVAGVTRKRMYEWQEHDLEFAAGFREAENQAIEALEVEARTRATSGARIVREVWRGDQLIERVVEYRPSDTVLIKLLQALRPDKYGDKLSVTQTQIVKTIDSAAWDAV
jgi:hypothetical protein